MPQPGESPLARAANAIVSEDGFALGNPSVSADGASVVLPILQTRHRPRCCVFAAEVADRVSAVDVGRIDRLRVLNESSQRVFLPPGTLFRGRETPSRGTTFGVVLAPESTTDVEVRCVHASQPIRPSAVLRLVGGLAPDRVRRALLSRDQGLVWSAVAAAVAPEIGARGGSDDLLSAIEDSGREEHATPLPPIWAAATTGPCGAIFLGRDGVTRVEICDSPESWRMVAAGEDGWRSEGTTGLRAPSGIVTLSPERAVGIAKDFLARLAHSTSRQTTEHSWESADGSSACTFLGEDAVHLIAFGGDPWTESAAGGGASEGDDVAPEHGGVLATSHGGPGTEGDVAVAQAIASDADEDAAPAEAMVPRRNRKVLTSGWDATTFESLERFSKKEFGGDRSAALRFLARQGLRRRGYMGPKPPRSPSAPGPTPFADGPVPGSETARVGLEARLHDFERIAGTDGYAPWLRVRAREEIERMVSSTTDETLQVAARSALERLPLLTLPPEPEELPPKELPSEPSPPTPPPVDLRPLLRRAFAASAAGQYSDALHLLDEVLDSEPENRTALLGRAVALRRSGKAPEALAALEVVLHLEPTNAAALLNRGRVLQEMGDLRGALDTFDRLADVAPNDWDVWVARGDVLARMGRIHDALAAYSEAHRRNPDDEGVAAKIRGLERARPPPPPTPAARAALPREIQEGQSYLVREPKPDLSYRLLRSLVVRSVPALVVSRQPATKVWAEHALHGVSVIQLSHDPGEGRIPPTSLALLTSTLERFVTESHGRGAILLDGLSLLLQNNGFRDTALFLERVNETILPSHAVFLVSVAPGDMEEKELALLERGMRSLS